MSMSAHLFASAMALPSVAFVIILLRRGQLRTKYTMLWLPVGGAIVLLSIVPGLLDVLSSALGVSYPPTLLFVAAIALLMMVCIHFSWELSRLEERVRAIAERIAIDAVPETARSREHD
jgi:hypothetical protein